MKNLIVIASILAAILSSILLMNKNHEAVEARAKADVAETERSELAARADEAEKQARRLKSQLYQTRTEAEQHALEAEQFQQQLTNAAIADKEHPTPGAELLRDPEMKQALMDEAREGTKKNVAALFQAGLANELQLNEEQATSLKQLLVQRMSALIEGVYLPMMTGELDDAEMSATAKAAKQAYDEKNSQVRALLGDEAFRQLEVFEKTQPERDKLRRFTPQFNEAQQSLSDDQRSQLLNVMMEERLKFKPEVDVGDPNQWDLDRWYDNFTLEKISAYGVELGQMNDRIVQRAGGVLTPEQAALLKSLLQRQAQREMFTAKSTTAMFGKNRKKP